MHFSLPTVLQHTGWLSELGASLLLQTEGSSALIINGHKPGSVRTQLNLASSTGFPFQRKQNIQKAEKKTTPQKSKMPHQHEDTSQIKPAAPRISIQVFCPLSDESIKQMEWGRETKFILF